MSKETNASQAGGKPAGLLIVHEDDYVSFNSHFYIDGTNAGEKKKCTRRQLSSRNLQHVAQNLPRTVALAQSVVYLDILSAPEHSEHQTRVNPLPKIAPTNVNFLPLTATLCLY